MLTEEEAAESTRQELERIDGDQRVGDGRGDRQPDTPDGRTDVGRAYNEFWRERGRMLRQTSLIVDPVDGRIPYRPEARASRSAFFGGDAELPAGPEDRGLAERCILWSSAGPPMLPTTYNSNFQLVQTPGYVVILNEMIHDVRIVPLDGRPHLGDDIRQWLGDSRGHWEDETLVVDTTNFTDKTKFRGSSARLHLVERFTRVSADTPSATSSRSTIYRRGRDPGPPRGPSRRFGPPLACNTTHQSLGCSSTRVTRGTTG